MARSFAMPCHIWPQSFTVGFFLSQTAMHIDASNYITSTWLSADRDPRSRQLREFEEEWSKSATRDVASMLMPLVPSLGDTDFTEICKRNAESVPQLIVVEFLASFWLDRISRINFLFNEMSVDIAWRNPEQFRWQELHHSLLNVVLSHHRVVGASAESSLLNGLEGLRINEAVWRLQQHIWLEHESRRGVEDSVRFYRSNDGSFHVKRCELPQKAKHPEVRGLIGSPLAETKHAAEAAGQLAMPSPVGSRDGGRVVTEEHAIADLLTQRQWRVVKHLLARKRRVRFSSLKTISGAFLKGDATTDRAVESAIERVNVRLADAEMEIRHHTSGDGERWAWIEHMTFRN